MKDHAGAIQSRYRNASETPQVDASDLSPCRRERYYWTNIPLLPLPAEPILLQSVLVEGTALEAKAPTITCGNRNQVELVRSASGRMRKLYLAEASHGAMLGSCAPVVGGWVVSEMPNARLSRWFVAGRADDGVRRELHRSVTVAPTLRLRSPLYAS